jgi:hypothetical protein
MLNQFQLNLIKDILNLCVLEKESVFLVNQQLKQFFKLNLLLKQQHNSDFNVFVVVDDVYTKRLLSSFIFKADQNSRIHVCTFSEHNKKLSTFSLNLYLLGSIHDPKMQQTGLNVKVISNGVRRFDPHHYSLFLHLNNITNLIFFGTLIKKALSNYA